ncbi:MAG: hypothetical protein KKD65_12900 [Gammaproteobacteria bacterium]|nr:hypothetical protein [Gammaproteobacteria bacterium]
MNKSTAVMPTIGLAILVVVIFGFWKVNSDLKSMGGQSGLQNYGLGKSTAYDLRPNIKAEIDAIEQQLADQSKWPKMAADVQKLNEQLAKLVNELSPSEQEELLPRLVPRRWEIDALWILANKPTAPLENLLNYAKSAEFHLSKKPFDSSNELGERLLGRIKEVQDNIATLDRASALDKVKRAIDGQGDIDEAARILSRYDDKDLAAKLNEIIQARGISNDIDSAGKEMGKYEKISDGALKEYAIVRLNQALMDIRLRMISTGLTDEKITRKLGKLEKTVTDNLTQASNARQSRDAEKMRKYQVWALGNIQKVGLGEIEKPEKQKNLSMSDRVKAQFPQARKSAKKDANVALRDAMILHMAPINQGILDEAVAQLFRKVYQKRFDELDEVEQLEVIKRFSTTIKKLPV